MSPKVCKGTEAHGWKRSRIVLAVRILKYEWFCVYAPINRKNWKGREEIRMF